MRWEDWPFRSRPVRPLALGSSQLNLNSTRFQALHLTISLCIHSSHTMPTCFAILTCWKTPGLFHGFLVVAYIATWQARYATSTSMGTGTPGVSSSRGSPERSLPAPNSLYIQLSVHNAESSGPYNRSPIYLFAKLSFASTAKNTSTKATKINGTTSWFSS